VNRRAGLEPTEWGHGYVVGQAPGHDRERVRDPAAGDPAAGTGEKEDMMDPEFQKQWSRLVTLLGEIETERLVLIARDLFPDLRETEAREGPSRGFGPPDLERRRAPVLLVEIGGWICRMLHGPRDLLARPSLAWPQLPISN